MYSSGDIYQQRINKVIDYLNDNLNESQNLEHLASVAAFSSFHFHRIFVAVTGETVFNYSNRIRLEKAAKLLRFSKHPISDISTDSGYSSPPIFSRSFKRYFGLSPSAYRQHGEIKNSKIRKGLYPVNQHLVPMSVHEMTKEFQVLLKTIPERRIAFIRVRNSFEEGRVQNAFSALIDWAKDVGVFNSGTFFGMSADDPLVTPKDQYTYEVAVRIPSDLEIEKTKDIEFRMMPQCIYATSLVQGSFDRIATAIHYLFNHWLINSNYEPEQQPGMEVYQDNSNINNWEHFDLELCIPVRKLQVL